MDVSARLSSKGQLTVPRAVRDALSLAEGDEVIFRVEGDRAILGGVPVGPELVAGVPTLVIGSGVDGGAAALAAERLAAWLGAEQEQFGAASHYGLLLAEEGHRQVADRVRSFLEAHHL